MKRDRDRMRILLVSALLSCLMAGVPTTANAYCQFTGVNMKNQNGGIIANPTVYDVFIDIRNGTWWSQDGANYYWSIVGWGVSVLNSKSFWSRVSEYNINPTGTVFTSNDQTIAWADNPAGESSVTTTLEYLLSTNSIPYSANTIYVIYLSPNFNFSADYHHSYFSASKGANIPYAIIDNENAVDLGQDNNSMGSLSSHEIMEAATDPWGPTLGQYGWVNNEPACQPFLTGPSSCEIGDVCGATNQNNGSVTGAIKNQTVSLVWSQQACRCVLVRTPHLDDFDGDGYEDPAIWQGRDYYINPPPNHFVYWSTANNGSLVTQALGVNTDYPAVADYDGDWKADFALWEDGYARFLVLSSRDGTQDTYYVGSSGDDPVPADFDGDGVADPATWTASGGMWHVAYSSLNHAVGNTQWGGSGDWPEPADYDGDGIADFAVFRPSDPYNGYQSDFIVLLSTTNNTQYNRFTFGQSTDIPAAADLDGDGLADPAVYRQSTSTFIWLSSAANFAMQTSPQVGGGNGLPMPRRWVNVNGGSNAWNNRATYGAWDYWIAGFYWNPPLPAPFYSYFRNGDSTNLPVSEYYY